MLAYKPGRRAVLRLDGHVVKIYAGDGEFAGAVIGLEASSRLGALADPAPRGRAAGAAADVPGDAPRPAAE